MKTPFCVPALNRRDFLYGLTSFLGALAMTDLMAKESAASSGVKKPMHEPKAKNVIMLFMEGGPAKSTPSTPNPSSTPCTRKKASEPAPWSRDTSFSLAVHTVRAR